jgi:hypothetical protein
MNCVQPGVDDHRAKTPYVAVVPTTLRVAVADRAGTDE